MNKFPTSLTLNLTLSSLALTGAFLTTAPAHAFDFSLGSNNAGTFTYTVTLDANDSLSVGDQLILTGLSGVTNATASSPYNLAGFDASSANFVVNTSTSGTANLTGIIQINSPDYLNNAQYQAFFTNNGTPAQQSGSPSTSAAVPFEFSPGLGIILVAGSLGLHKLKGKFNR